MNDWQKDLISLMETVTSETERFFKDVNDLVEVVTEDITETFDLLVSEIETEIEQVWRFLFDPLPEETSETQATEEIIAQETETIQEYLEDPELFINPKVDPSLEYQPACVGCVHYHGRIYSGNILICGMHPYGWMDENCPDWEGAAE